MAQSEGFHQRGDQPSPAALLILFHVVTPIVFYLAFKVQSLRGANRMSPDTQIFWCAPTWAHYAATAYVYGSSGFKILSLCWGFAFAVLWGVCSISLPDRLRQRA